jgi:hypothetical protein
VSENSQHASSPRPNPRLPSEKYRDITAVGKDQLKATSALMKMKVKIGLKHKSESELEALLQRDKPLGFLETMHVLQALIQDRHVEPRARHYKALILANTSTTYGRPHAVRQLLEEMEDNNIAADSGTLHAALQVRDRSWKAKFLVS